MSVSAPDYRLDGIYTQRQDGYFMQRVKLPAGVISTLQAKAVAAVSNHYGQGTIHLTSRGSMEIHWLKEQDLPQIKCELARAGLTSRGACGGAVRGITTGSQGAQGFPALESLARRLHRHFTGNPRFERLPKKFKIGIEADVVGGRHLIQDVGLVLSRNENERTWYDIWIAGGLGREPRPGFLLAEQVAEERIIPVVEAIIRVYAAHAPAPKRLKYLAEEFGEERLRELIEAESSYNENVPEFRGISEQLVSTVGGRQRLTIPVFAGHLTAEQLEHILRIAEQFADGVLLVTSDQDLTILLNLESNVASVTDEILQTTGLTAGSSATVLRVCPGSHECRMGLSATREIAEEIMKHIGEVGRSLTWALSGCQNSCTQPQLADVGIVTSALTKDEHGERLPRFDLYLRLDGGLGSIVAKGLGLDELCSKVRDIG